MELEGISTEDIYTKLILNNTLKHEIQIDNLKN
jgi:hypothetical protein